MRHSAMLLGAAKGHVQKLASQRGSTLVWVMVVILVLVIALGVGLTSVSGRFGLSNTRHSQTQAYYTALSSTQTVADWIMNEGSGASDMLEDVDEFGGVDFAEDLPAEAGECEVNLSYVDEEMNILKITSTATYAGLTETVSLILQKEEPRTLAPQIAPLPTDPLSTYEDRATYLNTLASGGVVPLYEKDSDNNSTYSVKDLELLNDHLIKTADSTLEARWTHMDLTSSSSNHDADILGTAHHPASSNSDTDNRRFIVPLNGRITIDPMEDDTQDIRNTTLATDSNNTKLITLAIDKTAGKDVLFRLASGTSATNPGLIVPGETLYKDLYRQSTYPYSKTTPTPFVNRSEEKHNSLLMLNFVDSASSTPLSYTLNVPDGERSLAWHPNNWNSMDLFVQETAGVKSNILLGPFGHKYDQSILDYLSYGAFVDNWNGTTAGEAVALWPNVSNTRTKSYGLPIFPVYFGTDAGFWILDKRSDRYFRTMQGANILGTEEEHSVIYSTRPTIIGGALIRGKMRNGENTNNYTTDGLNTALLGFANDPPASNIMYVESTTRYSQLIYNTDIILKAPTGATVEKPAKSTIRRPDTWRDRNDASTLRETDKNNDTAYNPTMTIKGGTIYVDAGQELTIQGTATYTWTEEETYLDEKNKKQKREVERTDTPDNMWISPDEIIVATGGALVIEASNYTNVLTDIYVDGGKLTINAGAKIKGNIYVYNGGTVDILGDFTLDSASNVEADREKSGLIVYGTAAAEAVDDDEITSAGHVTVPNTLLVIAGTSNKVHLVGGELTALVSTNTPATLDATDVYFLCDDHDPDDGQCPHYGGQSPGGGGSGSGLVPSSADGVGGGGWRVGSFSDG